jgi:squalene-hopene/tetraprenyl-beta-curcumene cyclase
MKKTLFILLALILAGVAAYIVMGVSETSAPLTGDTAGAPAYPAGAPAGMPLEGQAAVAIIRGVDFLLTRQMENGSWLDHPAVTSLACTALAGSPVADGENVRQAIERGLDFVVGLAQPDGAIWNTETEQYPNYSTAISLIGLAVVNRPQDLEVMRKARQFLLGSQFTQVSEDDPAYGGIGYGKQMRPDLSNTQWALEALYLTEYLDQEPYRDDPQTSAAAGLAWGRALAYLRKVQNLPQVNDAVWVAADPDNRGGFVYMPGESKAGEVETDDGTVALRSYGSMTYAGLKSLIYARLERDDPRVQAALDWIRAHYTWDENPGMEMAGYFYYVHTASKALAVFGQPTIRDESGNAHDWREDVIRALLSRQQEQGQWQNENGRWWESIPELTTAYSLIALEIAAGKDELAGLGQPAP